MSKQPIVCDTTVLLYLGRIGHSRLLPDLFAPVCIPEAVLLELDMGRLLRPDTINPRILPWAMPVAVSAALVGGLPPNRLGTGERATIAYAQSQDSCIAGLDDLRARQLAESMGLRVIGTLGVLLRAQQTGLIAALRPLIDDVIAQGFHLSPELYRAVLELAGEAR